MSHDKAEIRVSQHNPMAVVVSGLAPEVKPFTRIVGRWLWVEFPERPESQVRDSLIVLGFRWNPSRRVWQHSCGTGKTRKAPYDPRGKYGEAPVEDIE